MNVLKKTYLAFPFIFFVLIISVLWRGLNLHPNLIPSPLINKPAPFLSLPNLFDSKKMVANKNWLGHVVLVNVWASWCTACAEEQATLVHLAADEHLFFIGLNYKDDNFSAKQWLKLRGNPYQMVAVDQSGMTAIDWGVYGVPETFVLDKKGVVRYKQIGPINAETWINHLKPLLMQLQSEVS